MQRVIIVLTLVLAVLLFAFIGYFDLNDHRQWIARQLGQASGYQLSFIHIDQHGWLTPQFTINGLVVSDNQQLQLTIERLNIEVSAYSLIARQLEVALVELNGVNLQANIEPSQNHRVGAQSATDKQQLPWSWLQVKQLEIEDVNVQLSHGQQHLQLQKGRLQVEQLVVIADNQLTMTTLHKALPTVVNAAAKQMVVQLPGYPQVSVDNLLVGLQDEQNNRYSTHLSARLFSGELRLQAALQLTHEPLTKTGGVIEQLTVNSLEAVDMHLPLSDFISLDEPEVKESGSETVPLGVNTVLVQQLDLNNVSVSGDQQQLALTIKDLNIHLQDLYLVKNQKIINLLESESRSGTFALQYEYLQWQDMVSESFKASGTLAEGAQKLSIINE